MNDIKTNVTEKTVNSILGYTVEHNENKSINVVLNRNQIVKFEANLNVLNESLQEYNAPLQTFDDYVNNQLQKQLKTKGYIFNSFTIKDGSKTASSLTESQLKVKNNVVEFVEKLEDSVKIAGKTYLPDKDGNYKEVSLTFTTRADKQQGLTAKENQARINELVNDTLKLVKSEETETETKKEDSEESFEL